MTRWILFYSKYSPYCTTVLNLLHKYSFFSFITRLCIDNTLVRKQITESSSKLKITCVPCLVILKDDGITEQYTDQNVMDWLTSAVNEYKEQSEPISQSVISKPGVSQSITPLKTNPTETTSLVTSISSIESEPEDDDITSAIQSRVDKPITRPQNTSDRTLDIPTVKTNEKTPSEIAKEMLSQRTQYIERTDMQRRPTFS